MLFSIKHIETMFKEINAHDSQQNLEQQKLKEFYDASNEERGEKDQMVLRFEQDEEEGTVALPHLEINEVQPQLDLEHIQEKSEDAEDPQSTKHIKAKAV